MLYCELINNSDDYVSAIVNPENLFNLVYHLKNKDNKIAYNRLCKLLTSSKFKFYSEANSYLFVGNKYDIRITPSEFKTIDYHDGVVIPLIIYYPSGKGKRFYLSNYDSYEIIYKNE